MSLYWKGRTKFNPTYNWNYSLSHFVLHCTPLHCLQACPVTVPWSSSTNSTHQNMPTCQLPLEYIQLIQQVCALTVLQVEDTRCLIPTRVQLMMKLKQDATSELGRQLYKKSLFIYGVHTITVHDIMNNKHQQCFINPGKHDTNSHTSWH